MSTYSELQTSFINRAKALLDAADLPNAGTTDLLLAGATLKQLEAVTQLYITATGTLSPSPRSTELNKSITINGATIPTNAQAVPFTVPAGVSRLYVSGTAAGGEGTTITAPASAKKWFKSLRLSTGQVGSVNISDLGGGAFQLATLPVVGISSYAASYTFNLSQNIGLICSAIPRFNKSSPTGKTFVTSKRGYNTTGYKHYISFRKNYGLEAVTEKIGRQSTPDAGDVTDSIVVDDLIAGYTTSTGIVWTNDGWATTKTASLSGGPTQYEYTTNNSYCRRLRYFNGKLVTVGKSITASYTNNYVLAVDVATGVATTNLVTTDTNALYDIGYNGTVWVATGVAGKVWYCSTLNGTWAAATITNLGTADVYTIEVGGSTNNTFMIGAATGLTFSSTDGSIWTQRSTGLTQTIREYCIMYHPELGKWYATDNNATSATAGSLKVASGSDLSVWTTATALSYGANYVYYGAGGYINVLSMSSSAMSVIFSTDGATFADESFSNTNFLRGSNTVIADSSGATRFYLVGGEQAGSGGCHGGSSYGVGSSIGSGEGGNGGIGTSAVDTTVLLRVPVSPRAGTASASGNGAGVGIDATQLPVGGWSRKLGGGGGGLSGPYPGGGSCYGTGGGINTPSGPGAGGYTANSYGGGAGEGSWRYPVDVTPGETLILFAGTPQSGFISYDYSASTATAAPGFLTIEWRE